MPNVKALTCDSERAIELIARHLANNNHGKSSLLIADSHYERQQIIRRVAELGNSLGLRTLSSRSLLHSYPTAADNTLPLLADLDKHASLRASVSRATLHINIYLDLLRNSSFRNPLNLAGMFSSSLQEMSTHLDEGIAEVPAAIKQHSLYEEELNLLLALWDKYCKDNVSARNQRLEKFAQNLDGPLALLSWERPLPHIQRMLDATATSDDPALQVTAQLNGNAATLFELWNNTNDSAQRYTGPTPQLCPNSDEPLSLETAAEYSFALLQRWLAEGKRKIGIITYDRLLVRRLHSMCLQHDVHLTDRTGWLASNLLIGDILLACASLPDRTTASRSLRNTLGALEHAQMLRTRLLQPISRHLSDTDNSNWPTKVGRFCDPATPLANIEQDIYPLFAKLNSRTLAQWFNDLAQCTYRQPLCDLFTDDISADSLRVLLNLLCCEIENKRIQGPDQKIGAGEMVALLRKILTDTQLVISDVDGEIQLMSPDTLSTEKYDALLLLGANSDTLPALSTNQLLSEQVRRAIGLPDQAVRMRRQCTATALQLANHEESAAIWRGNAGISPYLDLIAPPHNRQRRLPRLQASWEKQSAYSGPRRRHEVTLKALPEKISPSSCDTLMACPYKFYTSYVLKIAAPRNARIFDPAEFGDFVHAILHKFHHEIMQLPNQQLSEKKLLELMNRCTNAHLDKCKRENKLSESKQHLLKWRWQPFVGKYIAEFLAQQQKYDATIEFAEHTCTGELSDGKQSIELRGKIDRVDSIGSLPASNHNQDNKKRYAIIDVKTGNVTAKISSAEKPQLALYVNLFEADPSASSYWQLNSKFGNHEIKVIGLDPELAPDEVRNNLAKIFFTNMGTGQPLPANAIDATCNYCAYEGMCRRSHLPRQTS